MTRKFYNRFIKPISKDSDQAEREIVLNYLLVGIFALAVIALIDTILAPIISNEPFYPYRVLNNSITVLFIIGLYMVARYKQRHKPVAIILTMLIALFGCFIALQWGVLNTNSILLLSLAVVMAGVLIGARYSLYVTCCLAIILAYLQHGESTGSLHPDLSWLSTKPTIGDVIGFSAILFVIALVSWLFNRQMELSLRRARHSEKALQRQKASLEIKVERRAQQLEAAQLDKMQELYRFAELGRLSTALFHDLANHLSTVSLDIEGLGSKSQSDIMRRISQNVGHIDTVVRRVREQIRGKSSVEVFSIMDEIDEVVKILAPAAEQAKVAILIEPDKSIRPSLSYKGDIIRFRQIILNLIYNSIEAYPAKTKVGLPRTVTLRLERQKTNLFIHVNDRGIGIPAKERGKIFRPFYTTKNRGAGIGLFIVKQVVENDFKGIITMSSDKKQGTTFSVSLPKSYHAKVSRS
jgi:signal transduction histidine kinase